MMNFLRRSRTLYRRGTSIVRFKTSDTPPSSQSTLDPSEISKFAAQASSWWHPNGSAAPLHRLNPLRLSYIRSAIEKNVACSSNNDGTTEVDISDSRLPLNGYNVIDVGCGAGLVTEPLTRLGANVLGVDMSAQSIAVAKNHAEKDRSIVASNRLKYEVCSVEDIAKSKQTFDAVLALEIIEHIPNPKEFLRQLALIVRPGGVLIMSTINRTPASYALAIVAVERIVRWLPSGTHEWSRFVRPDEISETLHADTPLQTLEVVGVAYNPITTKFSLVDDTSVNYMLTAARPVEES